MDSNKDSPEDSGSAEHGVVTPLLVENKETQQKDLINGNEEPTKDDTEESHEQPHSSRPDSSVNFNENSLPTTDLNYSQSTESHNNGVLDCRNSYGNCKNYDNARRSGSYTSPTDENGHLLPLALVPNGGVNDNNKAQVPNGVCSDQSNLPSQSSSTSNLRHRAVCMEECVPSHSSLIDSSDKMTSNKNPLQEEESSSWKISLSMFSSKKRGKQKEDKSLSKSIRRYYKTQDELITAFEELQLEVDDAMEAADYMIELQRKANMLAKISFFCNLLLLVGKAIAAGLSGSLAVISSVIDSAVDLASGALMWWSGRAMKRRNIYTYPQGRTKLEPIAIVILSVVMSLASVQMVRESIEKIIMYVTVHGEGPHFGIVSIVICSLTIVTKFVLFLLCRRVRTPGTDALSQDHRNDVLSNSIAMACGLIGDRLWPYADPIGAILISFYIMYSWFRTGWEQIKMLTGHTARPEFLKKITWIALNHHPDILLIDTVRAFHFGNNFLVEVDIVLDENMNLKKAHDIGESLQVKIERLNDVERAFVHLDYETEHDPKMEHKQV